MGCNNSSVAIIHDPLDAYYEPNGNLIRNKLVTYHNSAEELKFISVRDSRGYNIDDDCYIISSEWLSSWLDFAMEKSSKSPGRISNELLLTNLKVFDVSVKPKKDFKPIHRDIWEYFFILYGGGPVFTFKGRNAFFFSILFFFYALHHIYLLFII
jgi:hypothetical protein